MSNLFIGDRNHADSATISGGSWLADAPITNLQHADVSLTARSADALTTSTVIQWDAASAVTVQALALVNHNLSSAAQLRLSLGTTAGASDVYAGDWVDAWQVSTRAQDGINFMGLIVLPTAPSARYGKFEIDDTANADGYVEIGRLVVCDGWSPNYGAESGATHGWMDTSTAARTQGGRRQAISGRAYRTAEFSVPVLTAAEGDRVHDLQLVARTTDAVLYLPSLRDVEQGQRYGMWGVLSDLSPATWRWVGSRAARFRVEEL